MKKRKYITQEEFYSCRFGGIINEDDFDTNYPRQSSKASIADRIISDMKFDEKLKMVQEKNICVNKERRCMYE